MSDDLLGKGCALLSAVTWASALVLFKRSGEWIPPLALNMFKNLVGIVLLAASLWYLGDGLDTLRQFPIADIYILIISGVVGIALADTAFFHALNRCGVGIISIVDCTYSPFAILFAFLMLREKLSIHDYVGGALVVAAVFAASRHAPPPNRTRRDIAVGSVLGVLAMALMTAAIVFAKPVLVADGFPVFWATILRLIFGTLALAAIGVASPRRRQNFAVFRPSRIWPTCIAGSILGGFLSMVLWIAGFKFAEEAASAAMLNQTSVVFSLILAAVVLGEAFTRRKLVAVTMALSGVILIVGWGAG